MGKYDVEHGTGSPDSQQSPLLQQEALAPCVVMTVTGLNWERAPVCPSRAGVVLTDTPQPSGPVAAGGGARRRRVTVLIGNKSQQSHRHTA